MNIIKGDQFDKCCTCNPEITCVKVPRLELNKQVDWVTSIVSGTIISVHSARGKFYPSNYMKVAWHSPNFNPSYHNKTIKWG